MLSSLGGLFSNVFGSLFLLFSNFKFFERQNFCTYPTILRPLTVSFKIFKDFQGVCEPWVGMIPQEMPEFFSTINITNIFVSKKEKHSSLDMFETILRTLPKIRSRRRRLSISCRKVLYLLRPLQKCINFLWVAVVTRSSKWRFSPVVKASKVPYFFNSLSRSGRTLRTSFTSAINPVLDIRSSTEFSLWSTHREMLVTQGV